MSIFSTALPLFVPGVLIAVVIAALVASRLATALDTRAPIAILIVVGMGAVLAATLTPDADALFAGVDGTGVCDLERVHLPPLRELTRVSDTSLNVALFVPLGFAVGLLPVARRPALVVLGAISLTFVVEAIQLSAPVLGRGCESADLIDNLLGLAIGIAAAAVLRKIVPVTTTQR